MPKKHFDSMLTTIQQSYAFVLEQSKENIDYVRRNPANVGQAKQVNSALANIVAMERNMVMHRAVERALQNDQKLPAVPFHEPRK